MPQVNQLQSLLEHAKMVCINKHSQVTATLIGSPSTKFLALSNEQNALFTMLNQPSFFTTEIPTIDNATLEEKTTAIDVLDPSQFNEYQTSMEAFLLYLKENVLAHLQNEERSNQTNDWNLKVLDALRMMRRKITGRKRFFSNQGTDIGANPVYTYHRTARRDYREKLKKNSISSLETDEITINGFKEEIIDLEVVATFLEILERTNSFMDEKRLIASDDDIT